MTSRSAAVLLAAALLLQARPAFALAVNPFFTGSVAVDWTHPLQNDTVYDPQLTPIFGNGFVNIDVEHGMVDDGGSLGGPLSAYDFAHLDTSFDYHFWGPLVNNVDLSLGGELTYGFPAAGVFAVTWLDVANRDDPSMRNTFQVVFVGTSGYHTNAGFAIAPGSVIFSYGSTTDPHGTVHLSSSSLAAIAILDGAFSTLASFGIGDSQGVVSPADVAALQNSGDPFLFGKLETGGLSAPIAFDSIAEPVPEPAAPALGGLALFALAAGRRTQCARAAR